MIINQFRTYHQHHTDGDLYGNGEFWGYTLEDVGRPAGVKIDAETCIPEDTYIATVTYSPAFGRDMVVLYNIRDDHSIESHGVRYTGCRCHGGNTTEHTAGCILAAANRDRQGKVWGSIEKLVTRKVREAESRGEQVWWVISRAA